MSFQPAALPLCPAWHMSGAQEPGLRSAACQHARCSHFIPNVQMKTQKIKRTTTSQGNVGAGWRKREVVISYSLLSPPCCGWNPLEKFALCRVGLHACSSDCYLHDIAWSQRPWQTSRKTSSTGRHLPQVVPAQWKRCGTLLELMTALLSPVPSCIVLALAE